MGIQIEKIDKSQYELLSDVVVNVKAKTITVKKGFSFDGASIPKILWSIIGSPFTGNYTRSALVHDALYASEVVERKDADEIFLELMEQDRVSYLKRYSMYYAVRVGGYIVWKNHTEKSIKENLEYIKI